VHSAAEKAWASRGGGEKLEKGSNGLSNLARRTRRIARISKAAPAPPRLSSAFSPGTGPIVLADPPPLSTHAHAHANAHARTHADTQAEREILIRPVEPRGAPWSPSRPSHIDDRSLGGACARPLGLLGLLGLPVGDVCSRALTETRFQVREEEEVPAPRANRTIGFPISVPLLGGFAPVQGCFLQFVGANVCGLDHLNCRRTLVSCATPRRFPLVFIVDRTRLRVKVRVKVPLAISTDCLHCPSYPPALFCLPFPSTSLSFFFFFFFHRPLTLLLHRHSDT
jgi:hypothetical protein